MTIKILQGDCRDVLKTIPERSIQCVVTSPPYFGLRSYLPAGHVDKSAEIGCEKTPGEFVAHLVEVFRLVRRVLRDDGTVFLNLGDNYASARGRHDGRSDNQRGVGTARAHDEGVGDAGVRTAHPGFKAKDRMLIPARVAIGLHEDGWYVRDEIIWHKPRPTPHPVKDRTVCAHEMVYMLTKKASYFYDWEAVEEPSAYPGLKRKAGKAFRDLAEVDPNAARKRPGVEREIVVRETRRARSVLSINPSPYEGHFATMPLDLADWCIRAGSRKGDTVLDPFAGAGTTGIAADRLGRHAVLIELHAEHSTSQAARLTKDAGMFADFGQLTPAV